MLTKYRTFTTLLTSHLDDFVVPAAAPSYSTDSQESTPSGDTLTRQMRHISHQWRGVPVPVPEHVAEEFTSPSAEAGETPSSDERQSAADQSSGEGRMNYIFSPTDECIAVVYSVQEYHSIAYINVKFKFK